MEIGVLRIGIQRVVLLQVGCALLSVSFVLHGSTMSTSFQKRTTPVGLKNLGFSCYMNALFQALMVTPFFDAIAKLNEDCAKQEVIVGLLQGFYGLYHASPEAIDMEHLFNIFYERFGLLDERDVSRSQQTKTIDEKEAIKKKAAAARQANFKDPSQADASELLTYIVDWIELEKSCNVGDMYRFNVKTFKYNGGKHYATDSLRKDVLDASIVDAVSGSIDVLRSLRSEYTGFVNVELRGYVNAQLANRIATPLPDYFVVQNKLIFGEPPQRAQECIVPEWIDLKPFLSNTNYSGPTDYRLVSLIIHSGGTGSGHYIAYTRWGTTWYKCNDSTVTPMSLQFNGTAQTHTFTGLLPSLLFYVKTPRPAADKMKAPLLALNEQLQLIALMKTSR